MEPISIWFRGGLGRSMTLLFLRLQITLETDQKQVLFRALIRPQRWNPHTADPTNFKLRCETDPRRRIPTIRRKASVEVRDAPQAGAWAVAEHLPQVPGAAPGPGHLTPGIWGRAGWEWLAPPSWSPRDPGRGAGARRPRGGAAFAPALPAEPGS